MLILQLTTFFIHEVWGFYGDDTLLITGSEPKLALKSSICPGRSRGNGVRVYQVRIGKFSRIYIELYQMIA